MDIKTIKIKVENPSICNVRRFLIDEYLDYVNIEECVNNEMVSNYDAQPYILLFDGFDPPIDDRTTYHTLKIKNRDIYKQLRSDTKLILPEIILDKVNLDNSILLRIDINNCNLYGVLCEYHNRLREYPNTYKESDDKQFRGYIDLIYLKSNTPDDIIQQIIIESISKLFSYIGMVGLILESPDKKSKLINI